MERELVVNLRMQRQHLSKLAKESDYEYLFRQLSPVQTLFWIEPGSLPEIQYRCDFDQESLNDFFRHNRMILKGRFQGGNVAYVFADEMPLYMAAYKKEIKTMTSEDIQVLEVIKSEGQASTGKIKSETGLLAKEVSKSLQKLQKAFIVLENQLAKDDERPFSLLEASLSEKDLNKYTKEEAVDEVIRRFIYMNVLADETMIKSFTKFTNKEIQTSLERLLSQKVDGQSLICSCEEGYYLSKDKEESVLSELEDRLYIMDLNDYMVKSHELILKDVFGKSPYKTLHYILYKGEFIGRVLGHFRFGANDLEDVELVIETKEIIKLEDKIIDAIDRIYEGQENHVKRYNGLERQA